MNRNLSQGVEHGGAIIPAETSMGQAFRLAGHIRRRPRTFGLIRRRDLSGVSGVGLIAEGVVFGDGVAVLRWLGSRPTTNVMDSLEDVIAIHGHGATTQVAFDDGLAE